jgi:hypothetical protein
VAMNGAFFSLHAWRRVRERLTLSPTEVAAILDYELAVPLGFDPSSNRLHRLFFSQPDFQCFVAVQDVSSGEVVTVLPMDYHSTCSFQVSQEAQTQARALVNGREQGEALTDGEPLTGTSPILPHAQFQSFKFFAWIVDSAGVLARKNICRVDAAQYDRDLGAVLSDDEVKREVESRLAELCGPGGHVASLHVRQGHNGRLASLDDWLHAPASV